MHLYGTTPSEAANPDEPTASEPIGGICALSIPDNLSSASTAGFVRSTAQRSSVDHALLLDVGRGDEQAIAALYDKYSGVVYSVAFRILGDAVSAEDILHATFMAIWRSSTLFIAGGVDLAQSLPLLSRQRSLEVLRRKLPADLTEILLYAGCDVQENVPDRALPREVAPTRIEELAPEQREWLEMAVFEGKTILEISLTTRCPRTLIQQGIRSGLLQIRKH